MELWDVHTTQPKKRRCICFVTVAQGKWRQLKLVGYPNLALDLVYVLIWPVLLQIKPTVVLTPPRVDLRSENQNLAQEDGTISLALNVF
jgi:hypothetical protein